MNPGHPNPTPDPADIATLLDWPAAAGATWGGLPPFDRDHGPALEAAAQQALAQARAALRAIALQSDPPSFANTVLALETARRPLDRVHALIGACATVRRQGDAPAVFGRVAPSVAALDDEIAHDAALFARVDAVWRQRLDGALDAEQRRLVELLHQRLLRGGAALDADAKAELKRLNARLAELSAEFMRRLAADESAQAVFIDDESGLAGLSDAARRTAAQAATARGRDGAWAVPCQRPQVWAFLTQSTRRDLRERVWRMWNERGERADGQAGAHDNRPVVAEILRLRGRKARLLGHASFAHWVLADRMAGTPETVRAALQLAWAPVHADTLERIAALQALADAEGAGITLAPWDRLHYAERLRRHRFGLDAEAVRPYLPLEAVREAMFWSAEQLHGLGFEPLPAAPLPHPEASAWGVHRHGQPLGVLILDLVQRPDKAHGSHQRELRPAARRDGVLPVSMVVSGAPAAAPGEPPLLPWEYANVLFHEFGHALHMLCSRAGYAGTGSMAVAWDFIELPSLLHERWLAEPGLLARFARHHLTGEPLPPAMRQAIAQAQRHDRVFSLNLDFLAPALVDLELHLAADGAEVDAIAIERGVLARLGMPAAWDCIMRVPNNVHAFAGGYAAGLYSYLWADVMAADAAEAFQQAPGGLFDHALAERWYDQVLSAGALVPATEAFRGFRGRDPEPAALLRRFGLDSAAAG